jgi:toxin ParE1/3/4
MNKYCVELTDTAQSDIKDIITYISSDLKNPISAKKLQKKFRKEIFSLEDMPKKQNLVKDETLSRNGIRKLLVDHYLIFYVVDDSNNKVTVVRALYARRNWESLI